MPAMPMREVLQHLRNVLLQANSADLTDGQLLERFVASREPAALEALVRRHAPMVWGVCRRVLGNHHDAEDAFQAAFLVLVRKGASVYPRARIGNWLYGVAHQTALKARANSAQRKAREKSVTEMPEPAAKDPDCWNDLQPELDQEVSRLPEKYRAVIVLCELEGRTLREASAQLGCPEGTVASRLSRARTLLAKRLVRRGSGAPATAVAAALSQNAASASVPSALLSFTIKVAVSVAAGQTAATGAVSGTVAALTNGVIRGILLGKLKALTSALFVTAAIALGTSGLMHRSQAAGRADAATERTEDQRAYDLVKEFRGLSDSAKVGIPGNRIKERLRQLSQTNQVLLTPRTRDAIARILAEQSLRELVHEIRARDKEHWAADPEWLRGILSVVDEPALTTPQDRPQKKARKQDDIQPMMFQAHLLGPVGARIRLLRPQETHVQKLPCRLTFDRPGQYRLELTDIPKHAGLVLYPTVEVLPATAKTTEYLAHAAIPVAITDEDLELVAADRLATRFIALSEETKEPPVSIRGDEAAVEAAKKKGTLLLILRLGSIDLDPSFVDPDRTFRRQKEKDKFGLWQEYFPAPQESVVRPAAGTNTSRNDKPARHAAQKSDDTEPLGRILRVTAQGDKVYINLGDADNIRTKTALSVYAANSTRAGRSPKASLEVLSVLAPHLSLALVTSSRDPDREPLVQGDRLYKPASK
jgi:RNA polymerase sigma factor (sigma-70 family)